MEWTLPEDVVRHILSYAFPWHRDNVERERAWHVARGPPSMESSCGHSVFKPREILKRNRGRKSLFVSFCEGCGDPRGIYSVGWKTCMTSALHLPLRAAMPSSHLTGPFYTMMSSSGTPIDSNLAMRDAGLWPSNGSTSAKSRTSKCGPFGKGVTNATIILMWTYRGHPETGPRGKRATIGHLNLGMITNRRVPSEPHFVPNSPLFLQVVHEEYGTPSPLPHKPQHQETRRPGSSSNSGDIPIVTTFFP